MATWNLIKDFNPDRNYHCFLNTHYHSGDLMVELIGFRNANSEQVGEEKIHYKMRFKNVLVYEEVSESWSLLIEDLVQDDSTLFQTRQGCLYKIDNSIFKESIITDVIRKTMRKHYELIGIDFVLRVIAHEVDIQSVN